MRRPTLLELVICLAVVALVAALLTPAVARPAGARRPPSEIIPATISVVAGGLAAAGALGLLAWRTGRWLRSFFGRAGRAETEEQRSN